MILNSELLKKQVINVKVIVIVMVEEIVPCQEHALKEKQDLQCSMKSVILHNGSIMKLNILVVITIAIVMDLEPVILKHSNVKEFQDQHLK
jgi:hypothetical protein